MKPKKEDKGSYLLILRLNKPKNIQIGRLGIIFFKKGFYIYVGSAMRGLSYRVKRHIGLKKVKHWHIDKLRQEALFCYAFTVHSSIRVECKLADALSKITQWKVNRFGSSDCECETHLFGMSEDPICSKEFQRLIKNFRLSYFEPVEEVKIGK
jgi:sugar fermentation stimulation protein A